MKPEIFQCPNIWRVGCNNIRITARKKHDLDPVCCCSVLCYSQTEKKDDMAKVVASIWGAISCRAIAVLPRSIWKKRFKIQKFLPNRPRQNSYSATRN